MGAAWTLDPLPQPREGSLSGKVYAQMRRDFGLLAEPLTLHAAVPELLAGAWSVLRETLVVGSVPRERKERVALEISRLNRCPYCIDAHSIMLAASRRAGSRRDATDESVADPLAEWARATRTPGAPILASPPFTGDEAPEIIGTALCFHYINRMVQVVLGETPLPLRGRWFKGTVQRLSACPA